MAMRDEGTLGTMGTLGTKRPTACPPKPWRRRITRFLLLGLLIAPATAQSQLPIIRATPTPTPTPAATPSPTPTPTPTPTPIPTPIILVPVEPTAEAWRTARSRLFERAADLRAGLDAGAGQWDPAATMASARTDAALFRAYAVALAPGQLPAIDETIARLDSVLALYERQLVASDRRRLAGTLELIDNAMARLDELALEGDLAAGRASDWGYVLRPGDWGELRYPDGGAANATAGMDARALVMAISAKQRALSSVNMRELDDAEPVAREMGELARALVRRQGEVRSLSRAGFRNAALRLEVISENIVEYSRNRDRWNVRRQLGEMRTVLGEVGAYLNVANDSSLPADARPIVEPPRPFAESSTRRAAAAAPVDATPRPSPTPRPSYTPFALPSPPPLETPTPTTPTPPPTTNP